jgi:hypothetical protein
MAEIELLISRMTVRERRRASEGEIKQGITWGGTMDLGYYFGTFSKRPFVSI